MGEMHLVRNNNPHNVSAMKGEDYKLECQL